jgi:catechol 2,3-dioxygenase-like lactoylglutathione lyase family enzyme
LSRLTLPLSAITITANDFTNREITMIRGIHHVAISTPDIEGSVAFYKEAFGFETVINGGWEAGNDWIDTIVGLKGSSATQAIMKAGNTYIEIFQYHSPEPEGLPEGNPVNNHGYTHFCVDVTDIEAEYERLTKLGMVFHCPPGPAGEMGGGLIRATYGRDPFGNVVEIQEVFDTSNDMYLNIE